MRVGHFFNGAIKNNPDVLREALIAMQAREDAARLSRLERDPRDFSLGPANAPITIVEFFDYRCPYCMAALPWVQQTLRTRRDVRFVFKELPLSNHGQPALEAARASLAAMPQGRYFQFHAALLSFRGELTSARIDQLARQSGIDVARMRRRMNDPQIAEALAQTHALADEFGGFGTPGFFINGTLIQGFQQAALERQIEVAAAESTRRRLASR